jgi:phosphoglycolate phosphatase
MNPPVALLDLDGTLIDTRPGIVACMRRTLGDLGHALDPGEDLNWMIGPPMEQTVGRLLARWGDERAAEAVTIYRRHYAESGMFDATVYPGIAAALAGFAAQGWTLFVATAKRTRYARPILEHFGLAGYFHTIYGSEDGPRLDTKPVMLAYILAEQRFAPARAAMIGDRHYDIDGARANGLHAIGAAWGYGGADELALADAIAQSPEELPELATRLLGSAV